MLEMPEVENLPAIEELPDPFLIGDGDRVGSRRDWPARRQQIKEILLHYQYGGLPACPKIKARDISSRVVHSEAREIRAVIRIGESELEVRVGLLVPAGRGPFPVVLKNDRDLGQCPVEQEAVDRGYIVAEYIRHDLDRDDPDRSDGVHPLYPEYEWGTLSAWAWGTMRVVDYLSTLDFVDQGKIAVTGHSRGGKTALLAAALDERIALAVPNGSGTGGTGAYRVLGEGAETLGDIVKNFPYWFSPRFGKFVGRESMLPFDQHFLRALVAPRAVLSTDALGDHWANPMGTQQIYLASQVVFDWLGAGTANGIHFRPGGHDQGVEDWGALLDFADWVFFGRRTERTFDELPFPDTPEAFSWSSP